MKPATNWQDSRFGVRDTQQDSEQCHSTFVAGLRNERVCVVHLLEVHHTLLIPLAAWTHLAPALPLQAVPTAVHWCSATDVMQEGRHSNRQISTLKSLAAEAARSLMSWRSVAILRSSSSTPARSFRAPTASAWA